LSSGGPPDPTGQPVAPHAAAARGLAGERTSLAWIRSAIGLAAIGVLIARAAFNAHLDVLGVLFAIGMATIAALTWRHARSADRRRAPADEQSVPRPQALGLLTAATVVTAGVALVVTLAI
jgi:uncharacterized membrane protein YidH (DUF202 family)